MQGLSVAGDTHRQHSFGGAWLAVLDAARGPRPLVVVGDLLLDEYLHGGAARVAREAPVPAVTVTRTEAVPGGAGNLAANLAALGAPREGSSASSETTRPGQPPEGRSAQMPALDDYLRPSPSPAAGPSSSGASSPRANSSRASTRATGRRPRRQFLAEGIGRSTPTGLEAPNKADAVVVSDYGYGILVDRRPRLAGRPGEGPRRLVVDANDLAAFAAPADRDQAQLRARSRRLLP